MFGGGTGGLRSSCGVGDGQDVPQVEQRTGQAEVVTGLFGEPGGFAVVGTGLRPPLSVPQVDPAGSEQMSELPGADAHGLAENERICGELVGVRGAGERFKQCKLLYGTDSVEIRRCSQRLYRSGELLPCFG